MNQPITQGFISNKGLKVILVAILTISLMSNVMQMSSLGNMAYDVSLINKIIFMMSIPLMSYLLAVGFYHTANPKAYLGRLLIMAIIAQPLYVLATDVAWTFGNVLFSLALTLVVLYACFGQIALWQRVLLGVIPILLLSQTHKGLAILVCTLSFYYGYLSYRRTGASQKFRVLIPYAFVSLAVFVMAMIKPSVGALFGVDLTSVWGFWLVLPCIYWHNGRQDLSPKVRHVFYGLYPVMLACLLGAKMIV